MTIVPLKLYAVTSDKRVGILNVEAEHVGYTNCRREVGVVVISCPTFSARDMFTHPPVLLLLMTKLYKVALLMIPLMLYEKAL